METVSPKGRSHWGSSSSAVMSGGPRVWPQIGRKHQATVPSFTGTPGYNCQTRHCDYRQQFRREIVDVDMERLYADGLPVVPVMCIPRLSFLASTKRQLGGEPPRERTKREEVDSRLGREEELKPVDNSMISTEVVKDLSESEWGPQEPNRDGLDLDRQPSGSSFDTSLALEIPKIKLPTSMSVRFTELDVKGCKGMSLGDGIRGGRNRKRRGNRWARVKVTKRMHVEKGRKGSRGAHSISKHMEFDEAWQQGGTGAHSWTVPGGGPASWTDKEVAAFVLGLHLFGKDLSVVKRFVGDKEMKDILHYYYGQFYGTSTYLRWSSSKNSQSRQSVHGARILSGWRQQELLVRMLSRLPESARPQLLVAINAFNNGAVPLEDFVAQLKAVAGLELLVECVGIGAPKMDLTSVPLDPSRGGHGAGGRTEIPVGKACSTLSKEELVKFLTGDFRISKARANDLFWEAVWPRLLARKWHSEEIWSQSSFGPKSSLVFVCPSVQGFSKGSSVKGVHYYDSVSEVLNLVTSDPSLLDPPEVEEGGSARNCENEEDAEVRPDGVSQSQCSVESHFDKGRKKRKSEQPWNTKQSPCLKLGKDDSEIGKLSKFSRLPTLQADGSQVQVNSAGGDANISVSGNSSLPCLVTVGGPMKDREEMLIESDHNTHDDLTIQTSRGLVQPVSHHHSEVGELMSDRKYSVIGRHSAGMSVKPAGSDVLLPWVGMSKQSGTLNDSSFVFSTMRTCVPFKVQLPDIREGGLASSLVLCQRATKQSLDPTAHFLVPSHMPLLIIKAEQVWTDLQFPLPVAKMEERHICRTQGTRTKMRAFSVSATLGPAVGSKSITYRPGGEWATNRQSTWKMKARVFKPVCCPESPESTARNELEYLGSPFSAAQHYKKRGGLSTEEKKICLDMSVEVEHDTARRAFKRQRTTMAMAGAKYWAYESQLLHPNSLLVKAMGTGKHRNESLPDSFCSVEALACSFLGFEKMGRTTTDAREFWAAESVVNKVVVGFSCSLRPCISSAPNPPQILSVQSRQGDMAMLETAGKGRVGIKGKRSERVQSRRRNFFRQDWQDGTEGSEQDLSLQCSLSKVVGSKHPIPSSRVGTPVPWQWRKPNAGCANGRPQCLARSTPSKHTCHDYKQRLQASSAPKPRVVKGRQQGKQAGIKAQKLCLDRWPAHDVRFALQRRLAKASAQMTGSNRLKSALRAVPLHDKCSGMKLNLVFHSESCTNVLISERDFLSSTLQAIYQSLGFDSLAWEQQLEGAAVYVVWL